MSRFEIKFNDTGDHAEHAWLGLKDGVVVAGFATSNAAERWFENAAPKARAGFSIDRHGVDPAEPRKRLFRVWRGNAVVAEGFQWEHQAQAWIAVEKEVERARRTSGISNAEARRIHALLGRRS
jgi:hypothetical protein